MDYIRLSKAFITMPISEEWVFVLKNGITKYYDDDTALVNHCFFDGICIINSIYRYDKFTKSMLSDIRNLIIANDRVIISSSVEHIASHLLAKYGLIRHNNLYIKGF